MEYTKRVGRATFRAEVTHTERGDWRVRAGAFEAVIPTSGQEAEVWVQAGKPGEPAAIPAHVEAFLGKVARSKPVGTGGPKRVRYHAGAWMPLDGEERVYVIAREKWIVGDGPGDVVTGDVQCTSPRCRTEDGSEPSWLVVQLPGSAYDRADRQPGHAVRVEGVSPADFAEQHRAWHRDTYPPSPRVLLSQWIDRHQAVAFPEA